MEPPSCFLVILLCMVRYREPILNLQEFDPLHFTPERSKDRHSHACFSSSSIECKFLPNTVPAGACMVTHYYRDITHLSYLTFSRSLCSHLMSLVDQWPSIAIWSFSPNLECTCATGALDKCMYQLVTLMLFLNFFVHLQGRLTHESQLFIYQVVYSQWGIPYTNESEESLQPIREPEYRWTLEQFMNIHRHAGRWGPWSNWWGSRIRWMRKIPL